MSALGQDLTDLGQLRVTESLSFLSFSVCTITFLRQVMSMKWVALLPFHDDGLAPVVQTRLFNNSPGVRVPYAHLSQAAMVTMRSKYSHAHKVAIYSGLIEHV